LTGAHSIDVMLTDWLDEQNTGEFECVNCVLGMLSA